MDSQFEQPRHPIGVASERTGLSTDLIRAWERRYGATVPARDGSGQRLYSDADVERLGLLRRATEGGRSIGQVADLDRAALAELVRGDEAARTERAERSPGIEPAPVVSSLEARARAMDGWGLESSLRALMAELGFVRFAETVAVPLLGRLGDAWHAGEASAAQEHLATAAVRRVLESALPPSPASDGAPVVVVCTLPGERHETGVLAVAAAARLSGWRVVYLGPDLPVADVADAARTTGAKAVCVSGTYAGSRGVAAGMRELRAALPSDVVLFAGGPAVAAEQEELEGHGIRCPGDLTSLRDALVELADGAARRAGGG